MGRGAHLSISNYKKLGLAIVADQHCTFVDGAAGVAGRALVLE
jgi:hypothetical protein